MPGSRTGSRSQDGSRARQSAGQQPAWPRRSGNWPPGCAGPMRHRLVGLAYEWQARVGLGVDSHRADAKLAGGGYDPPGDLTTISDKDRFEHAGQPTAVTGPGGLRPRPARRRRQRRKPTGSRRIRSSAAADLFRSVELPTMSSNALAALMIMLPSGGAGSWPRAGQLWYRTSSATSSSTPASRITSAPSSAMRS